MKIARVVGLFVGRPKVLQDGQGTYRSSIAREPVAGPAKVTRLGLEGDRVTHPSHGGPDKALCVHLQRHYGYWQRRLGLQMPPGHLGENLTLSQLEESDICIGDVVQLGSALVQVSSPRIPCQTQARRAGRPDWVQLTIQAARTGFYLRVLEPGFVAVGDAWQLQARPHPALTVTALNQLLYHSWDEQMAALALQCPALSQDWRKKLAKKQAAIFSSE